MTLREYRWILDHGGALTMRMEGEITPGDVESVEELFALILRGMRRGVQAAEAERERSQNHERTTDERDEGAGAGRAEGIPGAS